MLVLRSPFVCPVDFLAAAVEAAFLFFMGLPIHVEFTEPLYSIPEGKLSLKLTKGECVMKKAILRVFVYVLMLVIFVGGSGVAGYANEQRNYWVAPSQQPLPSLQSVKVAEHDPNKPTVAVLLGDPTTEVFDFMVPYQMFAMTEAYNVYAVAPEKKVVSLTGGLDLAPHYSFTELDQLLQGKSPDLIVIPYIPMIDEGKYQPLRKWLQKHEHSNLLSICGGAGNLADAGLLKGRSATIHWQFFDMFQDRFVDTNWVRDQRYVHDGNIIGSAGLTSGIDAVLYVISKQLGEPIAEKIAKEMNYPSYHYVKNPKVDPYYVDRSEIVYMLNQAFQWNKTEAGVLLYDGMEDSALTTIFDTYAASGTTKVYTVSASDQPIVTKYQLTLFPRHQVANAPQIDKMFVTGTEAKVLAADAVKQWEEKGQPIEPIYIHSASPNRFVFDAPLEDLAKQEDYLTARYGAKRLEYRANHLKLQGQLFSLEAFGIPLLLIVFALLLAYYVDRRFILKKTACCFMRKTSEI